MVIKKEGEMHERTTNPQRKRETKKVHPPTEALNSQRLGGQRQRYRSSRIVPDPSPDLVSLEESLRAGSPTFPKRKKSRVDHRVRKLEKEKERLKEALALQTQGLMLLKKMNLV